MGLKNKFSKLGKILALSTALGAASLSNVDAQIAKPTNIFQMIHDGEKITYVRDDSIYREKFTLNNGTTGYNISYAKNIIAVEKPNGKKVIYLDLWGDNYTVDRIGIEQKGKSQQYDPDSTTQMLFKEAQERFDFYMGLIKKRQAGNILD